MTLFKILTQICGLSTREAAAYLDTRLDTIKSWSSGRNNAPESVIDELAELADRIDQAAELTVDEIYEQVKKHGSAPEIIELGLATDDHDAQSIGWPCVGTHAAVLGLVVSRAMAADGYRFNIVPRGSTVATAAAADRHE